MAIIVAHKSDGHQCMHISACRCMLYLYSSVEALVILYTCMYCMPVGSISARDMTVYRIYIESMTLSIPHVRSTLKNYTCTCTRRSLDLNAKLVACNV